MDDAINWPASAAPAPEATVWRGLPPTGRALDVDEVSFIRFRDGRIAHIWGLEDAWIRIRQLAGGDAALGEHGSLS